ncbi:MAG: hypothetical protein ACRC2T_19805 [Thermoguttaceae bacterium]
MYRRRKSNVNEMEAGQDSFLDIVSNIVGILVILVMVAGVRAKNSPTHQTTDSSITVENSENNTAPEDIKTAIENYAEKSNNFAELQNEVNVIGNEIERFQMLTSSRARERTELLSLIAAMRTEYELATENLSGSEQESLKLKDQIREADEKLAQIDRNIQWLHQNRPQATVLENRPTPLTKQVNDTEAHFRIKGGKISHIPTALLLEKMKSEVQNRMSEVAKKGEISGNIGPIEGYTMPFRVVFLANVPVNGGSAYGYRSEFLEAEFLPQFDDMGETLTDALSPQSDFIRRLRGYPQNSYTITLWVYPDSFTEYRSLKKYLFDLGYRTAARPLNNDDPIGASSEGSKSSAQ